MSKQQIKNQRGVMLNAYPDSIGKKFEDCIQLLEEELLKDCFSHFYILPTFFNSDLDRGFSIINYDVNQELVQDSDLDRLKALGIQLKFDIVLNHLSVASPQFKDLLENGEASLYKDFFIHWNNFWQDESVVGKDGVAVPKPVHLSKLFMRKSGLPVLKVPFPDGSEQPYWNTFYQKVGYTAITPEELSAVIGAREDISEVCTYVNQALKGEQPFDTIDWEGKKLDKDLMIPFLKTKRTFLGQMDLNAKSKKVWDFYEETLEKLANYGGNIIRLDAFAYLHKAVGEINFFNDPGTWDYLERIKKIADDKQLNLLPEIHAEYGTGLHRAVAEKGYMIYDFFFPGLILHSLESRSSAALKKWIEEILEHNYQTVNMLGCHDGIPVLDLKGKETEQGYGEGLLTDKEIEAVMSSVLDRGGTVKNLYDAEGKKISYYQINATFFSALGEDESKLLIARAIQLFMPGIPQIWYLDLFLGTNDYQAVERAGNGGHKEINRTNLSLEKIHEQLSKRAVQEQLKWIRFRNQSAVFEGAFELVKSHETDLTLRWSTATEEATLSVDLKALTAKIKHTKGLEVNIYDIV